MTADPPPDRLADLLADRATQGLSPGEDAELRGLLTDHAAADPDDFDLAAAATLVAFSEPGVPLPDRVRARLLANAAPYLTRPTVPPPRRPAAAAGWAAAAAVACVAGTWAYWHTPAAPPSLSAVRATLTADPAAVTFVSKNGAGVVWSPPRQTGVAEVRGLPPNDPAVSRYQFWVVDGKRPEPYNKVDGGLFDVVGDGPTLVPVRPTLPIGEPAAFAVTRETPAGAVVAAGPVLAVYTAGR